MGLSNKNFPGFGNSAVRTVDLGNPSSSCGSHTGSPVLSVALPNPTGQFVNGAPGRPAEAKHGGQERAPT
jgi:hypothetical protein